MKNLLFAVIMCFGVVAVSSSVNAQATSTPTRTVTPTMTRTATPTATYVIAITPLAKNTNLLPAPGVYTYWSKSASSTSGVMVALINMTPAKRIGVSYLEVSASAATTVTVTVGGVPTVFVFNTLNAGLVMNRTFTNALVAPAGVPVYWSQSGSATVVVNVEWFLG